MLWLALHLPNFPLEIFLRGATAPEPAAVCSVQGRSKSILLCNELATALGIKPGITVAAAQALTTNLKIYVRDQNSEQNLLSNLAVWAEQFTPTVSVVEGCGLLLEIEGSHHLFGGVASLLKQARAELDAMGYQTIAACAPTAAGAWLLTQAGQEVLVKNLVALKRRLCKLPVSVLAISDATLQTFSTMGINKLEDCLNLPRDGLTRRFGTAVLDEIDRALGERPDPRLLSVAAPRFETNLELPYDVDKTDALLFAARRLLLELESFLRGLGSGVQSLCLNCFHQSLPTTSIEIGLVAPSGSGEHLFALVRERLERTQLVAPVRSLSLVTDRIIAITPKSFSLLPDEGENQAENAHLLIERLQARLGERAVYGLSPANDHRPELAWVEVKPGTTFTPWKGEMRPNWLLAKPQLLKLKKGQPYWNGPLAMKAGPERIESGWWDDAPIARDYFVAHAVSGECLWLYRDAVQEEWYLHGLFS